MTFTCYSRATQATMKKIAAYLSEKYGEIQPQWEPTITTIADNLDMIADCKKEIKRVGLYNDRTGRKNPLIATIKDLQATNLKCFQQLGVTPWAESKIKQTDGTEAEDAELLKGIMMR